MDFKLLELKKIFKLFCIFSLLGLCLPLVYSQEEEPAPIENSHVLELASEKSFETYYFEQPEKGKPVFTQIIKWTGSAGVLKYEVTLKTEDEKIIFKNFPTTKTELHINLRPGKYRYKVYAYNMLNAIEQESDWIDVEVKKAFLPSVDHIKPERLYLEDEDFQIEVNGSGFTDETKFYFISEDRAITKHIKPENITDEKIVFDLQNPTSFLGNPYFLTVTDPSGLSAISKPFIVMYRKPMDFYVGVSYTPFKPVYDSWYTDKWNRKFYEIGVTAELGAIFLKTAGGFIGAEIRGTYRRSDLVAEFVTIKNSSILTSVSFLYEYWFLRKLAFSLKAGGGLAINKFVTEDMRKKHSFDPMYTIGLGLRVKPIKYLYIDFGIYFDQILNTGTKPIFISPEIAIGFRY